MTGHDAGAYHSSVVGVAWGGFDRVDGIQSHGNVSVFRQQQLLQPISIVGESHGHHLKKKEWNV